MIVKYNRVSTIGQSGERFSLDKEKYDLTLFDKISGTIPFKDRPKGKEIVKMVEDGKITQLVFEDFSRIGRNVGDLIYMLRWFDEHEVNISVLNIGLQSRPYNVKNPIWNMISSVMASIYEMELQNIKERTQAGRAVYVQKGGVLGRPTNSNESDKEFLDKDKTKEIIKYLNKARTIREISKITSASNKTIIKTKRVAKKHGLIDLV